MAHAGAAHSHAAEAHAAAAVIPGQAAGQGRALGNDVLWHALQKHSEYISTYTHAHNEFMEMLFNVNEVEFVLSTCFITVINVLELRFSQLGESYKSLLLLNAVQGLNWHLPFPRARLHMHSTVATIFP